MKNFKTYQLAVEFHRIILQQSWPSYLRDQVLRASSSSVLNLAEGYGLSSPKLKRRHYDIALGSHREVQAALEIANINNAEIIAFCDLLAAHMYKLCQSMADIKMFKQPEIGLQQPDIS